MRNTGITYSSAEKRPVVLPEFAGLLPPLSAEQSSALEADILANGCYASVIVDENLTIIDGHNRQRICAEHGLPYNMLVFSFTDALEAKQWALDTQKGRRNLSLWELGQIALKLKPDVEARAKEHQAAAGGDKKPLSVNSPKAVEMPVDTRKELAQAVGIGEQTMGRIMQIEENAPPAVKEAMDNKELSINQGYNITKAIQQLPEEERETAAIDAVALEKAKKEVRRADAETDRRAKISTLFSKAYGKAVQLEPTVENVRSWVEFSGMDISDMEDMIRESRDLSGRFAEIADILEQKIMPEDWRYAHGQNSTGG